MIQGGDLHGIIVMPGGSPPDARLQTILAEEGNIEDVFLHFRKKRSVGFFAADPECPADILQEMHMADLDDASGKDILRRHADGLVLIAGDAPQRVIHVLELREELHHCFKVLRGREETSGNVMRDVVHPVDEGNLLLVAFYCHILSIDNERSTKALPVAVPGSDVVVMRDRYQLPYELSVRSSDALPFAMGKRANARTFEMQREDRLGWTAVIDTEISGAGVAVVAIDASSCAFFSRSQASAKVTGKMASGSLFLGVNMFKDGKWLEHTEIYKKVAPEMERSRHLSI